jgi:hypothetical protein
VFCSRFPGSVSLRSVAAVVRSAPAVGFCGSRRGFVSSRAEAAFCSVAALVSAPVLVGCARGVDAVVRSAFLSPVVFSVSGSSRSAFAARSVRFVRALRARGGLLVSFPGGACPPGLVPSSLSGRCFCGSGSGSWASVAFAAGVGCPVLVWVPRVSWVPSWGFVSLGGGWFLLG